MAGRLFVISGPSGAGKGTLVNRVMSRRDGTWLSVSATTRLPREGEVDGVSYYFLTDDEFDAKIEEGDFLEWANVHTRRYGTLRSVVVEKLEQGIDVILEIDVQGALQVRENYPDAFLIFIKPPSFEELERRLVSRGTETAEQIAGRLEVAKLEMEQEKCYNVSLVNDELDRATEELLQIMDSQCKVEPVPSA
ncbi:MAG: guanylate kinase [Coriobacteriales bacterium]|jgi:guanylate kinase